VQISTTTEQILTSSTQHQKGSARQLNALVQTTSTTEELARSAKSVAGNATEVAEIARRTLDSAQQARAGADGFAAAMGQMKHGNEAITRSAQELEGCVAQIGKIVEFINGIADKSDLLALNAELEGVKAGEVGQGFSLVATEMRRMAENVTRSTREIEELIDRIREATSGVVRATEAGLKTSEGSASQVDAFSRSLAAIVELAGHTSNAVRTISDATLMQQSGTGQLADTMGDILSVAKEMEVATKAMIQANVELAWLANDIVSTVDEFRPA
jgi:methyl-accepting chemotaxis protein